MGREEDVDNINLTDGKKGKIKIKAKKRKRDGKLKTVKWQKSKCTTTRVVRFHGAAYHLSTPIHLNMWKHFLFYYMFSKTCSGSSTISAAQVLCS